MIKLRLKLRLQPLKLNFGFGQLFDFGRFIGWGPLSLIPCDKGSWKLYGLIRKKGSFGAKFYYSIDDISKIFQRAEGVKLSHGGYKLLSEGCATPPPGSGSEGTFSQWATTKIQGSWDPRPSAAMARMTLFWSGPGLQKKKRKTKGVWHDLIFESPKNVPYSP